MAILYIRIQRTAKFVLKNRPLLSFQFSMGRRVIVWIHGKSELISKVQIFQNKAQRIIHFKDYRHSATPLFKESGVLKMRDYASTLNCLFVHDQIHGKLPEAFNDYFSCFNEIHSHNTRGKFSKLTLNPRNTFRYGLCSVTSNCANDWNRLQNLLHLTFASITRNELKALLFKHYLNSYNN